MSTHIDLLAKSYSDAAKGAQPPTYARLAPHLRAVERAGEIIVEVAGDLILKQLDLPSDPWHSRLRRALKTACLCHDIGKANEGFQKLVRGMIQPTEQPARHELLSALLLSTNERIRNWAIKLLTVSSNVEEASLLLDVVIAAVGGHHIKLDEEWKKASIALRDGGCGTDLQLLLNHPDLRSLFGEETNLEYSFDLTGNKSNFLGDLQLSFKINSNRWKDRLKQEPKWWRFGAAVKALVMAADVAGSAMLPEKQDIREWITTTLSRRNNAQEMYEVVRARLKGSQPRPFQIAVGASEAKITLVEAGCGTGKTAGAYLWAARHAEGKKLFFCYPTTGTATEGFRGYVAETDIEAQLMHSRAIVDLEGIAEVRKDLETDDHLLRIESLRAWSPKVVVCTADTVLALVRNNRRGLYNSPAILSASFVFDELHAYEDRMFAAVVALINALPGSSFLLMTASLPRERKDFLLSELSDLQEVPQPKDLEELPRYTFEPLTKRDDADDIVKQATAQSLKVLWVCNTVSRAQRRFERLRDAGLPAKTYHSRFKYEDRRDRHRELIDAFGEDKHGEGFVAVTTQVAEMSLDLDADILISEIAPIPSLIQRLGRLNRRITPKKPGCPRPAYFFPLEQPENPAPYESSQLNLAEQWMEMLNRKQRALNQADLAEAFNSISPTKELDLDLRTEWLDAGYFAVPGPVREAGISVSVILPEDEALCRRDSKEIIMKAIPMNFRRGMENWRELKGNLIASPDTIQYGDEGKEVGARWLKR